MSADNHTQTPKKRSFTGRQRRKQTRWSVRAADVLSRIFITVGGIGTIVAVSLVFVFLAYVVLPLFGKARVDKRSEYATPWTTADPVHVAVDEYRTMGWALYPDGKLQIFRVKDGEVLEERQLFEGTTLTSASFTIARPDVAFGLQDGSVIVGQIRFEPTFREMADMPDKFRDLKRAEEAVFEKGVVKRTPIGQYRIQRVVDDLFPPVKVADGAVTLIDHIAPTKDEVDKGNKDVRLVYFSDDGKFSYSVLAPKENMFTGEIAVSASKTVALPYTSRQSGDAPDHLLYSAGGSSAYLAWEDGLVRHYDTRRPDSVEVVEEVDVLAESDATLTVFHHLIGRETIMCGDSAGGFRAWFLVRGEVVESGGGPAEATAGEAAIDDTDDAGTTADVAGSDSDTVEDLAAVTKPTKTSKQQNFKLVMAHELHPGDAAVKCVGSSERSRMIAVGYENGDIRVYHVTADHLVLQTAMDAQDAVTQVIITPKDNGLIAAAPGKVVSWDFDPKHPEATWASLFLPVWYEGYSEPIHMWQSSFAGVESEMKLGLYPLIFGTIKATFYSMLFGAPLALLAAIYTSEFVYPSVRSKVKPTIEVMASLPSVVLGFLAALVFAPIVETIVPAVLSALVVIPVTLMIGSFLWQLLPRYVELVLNRYGMRLVVILFTVGIGVVLSLLTGPLTERLFFAGNIMRWLDDRSVGDGTGAWMFLLLPASAVFTVFLVGSFVNPALRQNAANWSRFQFGLINLAKFVLAFLFTFSFAWGLSWLLTNLLGLDPRGSYVATYEQRNALVVGFAMGFAIIPIIYTIAEDALSTVPKHLRSASLGAGATPWQTATRVVIPTAMSGLFSALMVGLGRAVGETMIVLMAAGNTPVMDWNFFNGFRTLSANIAVELPEAVRDSTHYRTLFLAALTLFVMTFVVNTIAERVRLRFRRRAYQL